MKTYNETRLVSYSVAVLSLFTRATSIKGRRVKAQIPHPETMAPLQCFWVWWSAQRRLASAQFDPSLQFSPIANPNGVWTYGYRIRSTRLAF